MKILIKIWYYIQRYIFVKICVILTIIFFFLRKIFFGFENANQYLSRVDKHAIIPILRLQGAIIGINCDIETGLIFHNCKNYKNFQIGNNCHIGKHCFFDLKDKIILDDNVVISMRSTFITHIDMIRTDMVELYKSEKQPVIINKNVYLGANTTVLKGVVIGTGSVIGAGSLVKNVVEPYSLMAGVPVKLIKKLN